ncbi:MAG: FAD-dependent oxidoreductase [Nitrosomonadales bacterium]|nr:FAD-dependent oxidoreductase [Nitrosomonadales bacterium]
MNKKVYNVDICIIGAGSAGLSVASGAAQLGRSVVLFEANEMGGDCLNYGCIPSKALISAAKKAHIFKKTKAFGVDLKKPNIKFQEVQQHVHNAINTIAPADSQERFEGLGCTVIREYAEFKNQTTVISPSAIVTAKRFVIASGSKASVPPIPGIDDIPFLTNETIFTIDKLPKNLIIIGAGPIGLELGQAFSRLGSSINVIDAQPPLVNLDKGHSDILIDELKKEGINFHYPVKIKSLKRNKSGLSVELENGKTIQGSHLLLAAGRSPNIKKLGLEKANVVYDRSGVKVNKSLRTSNKRIYAAGDVTQGMGGLTHAAGYHAGKLIQNFYFSPPLMGDFLAKANISSMPSVIYSEPEFASIGLTEKKAEKLSLKVKCLTWSFNENDRAISELSTLGGVKIIANSKGKILGGSIIGEQAGEMIHLISMAMVNNIKISGLAKIISPYPTRSEAIKRASSSYYTNVLFSNRTKKIAGFLSKFH